MMQLKPVVLWLKFLSFYVFEHIKHDAPTQPVFFQLIMVSVEGFPQQAKFRSRPFDT